MSADPFRVDDALLRQCAAEPIQVPGSVQAHGLLLVLSPDLRIEQAAGASLLDVDTRHLPDQELTAHVTPALAEAVRAVLTSLRAGMPRDLGVYTLHGRVLDASVHRHDGLLLLELVPHADSAPGLGVAIESGIVIAELLDSLGRGELPGVPLEAACAQVAERLTSMRKALICVSVRSSAKMTGTCSRPRCSAAL